MKGSIRADEAKRQAGARSYEFLRYFLEAPELRGVGFILHVG